MRIRSTLLVPANILIVLAAQYKNPESLKSPSEFYYLKNIVLSTAV